MRTEPKISDADVLLDELDRLARSTDSNAVFWRHFLTSLKTLVNAESVAILIPMENHPTAIAQLGPMKRDSLSAFETQLREQEVSDSWLEDTPHGSWFVVPLQPQDPESGWLLLTFQGTLASISVPGLTALAQAFAEVYSTRDAMRRNRRMQKSWELSQHGMQLLTLAESREALHRELVDQLVQVLGAARVSLAVIDRSQAGRCLIVATSGVSKVDATAPAVRALLNVAFEASKNQRPQLTMDPWVNPADEISDQEQRRDDGVFENRLAIPWDNAVESGQVEWLVIEWPDRNSMADALPTLSVGLAPYQSVYRQQSRWCSLPIWLRQQAQRIASSSSRRSFRAIRRIGFLIAVAVLIWGLMRPYPLLIEAEGILEPVSKRMVHATSDGTLLELYVEDGDEVVKDQQLARLRSPGLELQIEEALGQMRAMVEKRNGLHVAINQLSPTSQDALPTQTRISTDLLVLETQEKHIREKLEFLKREQGRLLLTSPIDGMVVASELRRELENRPLKRGDTLFQVVDLKGDWQLRVFVSDKDSGYVDAFYGAKGGEVEYVFESSPSERLRGTVKHMANVIENRTGIGSYRDVLVSVDHNDANRARMGASALVSMSCGKQPFWFVWSRPLIEFTQKRFGFFSTVAIPPQTSEPNAP